MAPVRTGASLLALVLLFASSAVVPLFMLPAFPASWTRSAPKNREIHGKGTSGSAWSSDGSLRDIAGAVLAGVGLVAIQVARGRSSRDSRALSHLSAVAEAKSTTAAKPKKPPFDPAAQVGAIAPLGYFDPLGFSKAGDKAVFYEFREAELKHGRVAMMASIGLVMQHFVHLPVPDATIFVKAAPTGIGAWAVFYGPVGFFGLLGFVFFTAIFELFLWVPVAGREPGNFGDPLGLNMYSADMRNRELSNGRFAMIALMGMLAAEVATGKDAIQQLGF